MANRNGTKLFGIIDRETKTIEPFRDEENILHLNDEYELEEEHTIGNDSAFEQAIEEFMLVEEAGEKFDNGALLNGDLTPVFLAQHWLISFRISECICRLCAYA